MIESVPNSPTKDKGCEVQGRAEGSEIRSSQTEDNTDTYTEAVVEYGSTFESHLNHVCKYLCIDKLCESNCVVL